MELEWLEERVTPTSGAVSNFLGTLQGAAGMALDGQGNVYVACATRITKVSTSGQVTTFASGFGNATGLASDGQGNLYVGDYYGGTVSKVTPDGHIRTFATGFLFDTAIAFDQHGNLFVANLTRGTVDEVTPAGHVSTFATGFVQPRALAFDAQGNLYVANFGVGGNTVSKVTPAGQVSTFATGFNDPTALAFDAQGNLYVASTFGAMSKVTPQGKVSPFASGFFSPNGLVLDGQGNLIVADAVDNTLSKVTPIGQVSLFAQSVGSVEAMVNDSLGNLYVASEDRLGKNTMFKATPDGQLSVYAANIPVATALAFDSHSNLYLVSQSAGTLSKITPQGQVSTFASGFNGPAGLAIDGHDSLVVSNYGAGTISEVTPAAQVSTVFRGFTAPTGLAFDRQGNLYVADAGKNAVDKVALNGHLSTYATGFYRPTDLAFDARGDLYVLNTRSNDLGIFLVSQVTPQGAVSSFIGGGAALTCDGQEDLYVGSDSVDRILLTQADVPTTLTLASDHPAGADYGEAVQVTATMTAAAGTPTGAIRFIVDGTGIGSLPLSGNSAHVSLPLLAPGAHAVIAEYLGDARFQYVTTTLTQPVFPATTTITVSVPASAVYGQLVTATAAVQVTTGGTAAGAVEFMVDGILQGVVAPDNQGKASLPLPVMDAGSHKVTATFLGDTNFQGSTTAVAASIKINMASTDLALTSSANPAAAGQAVTFIVTLTAVAPGGGIPTGTVTFTVDGSAQAPVPIDARGQAVFPAPSLSTGSHTVRARYSGDPNVQANLGGPALTEQVQLAGTRFPTDTTLVVPSPFTFPPFYPQPVTFRATVVPFVPIGPAPTLHGSVVFNIDGVDQTPVPVDASGNAALTVSALGAGNHSIAAHYSGDAECQPSDAPNGFTQQVEKGRISTFPTRSAAVARFGAPVIISVTLNPAGQPTVTPAGPLTFSVDGAKQSVMPRNGQASLTLGSLSVGMHTVTVSYSGDQNLAGASALGTSVQIIPDVTRLTLTSSASAPIYVQPLTFTAQVSAFAGGTPSGSILFTVDGTAQPPVPFNASGQATLALPALAIGNHSVVAAYSNDPHFQPSSSAVTLTILPVGLVNGDLDVGGTDGNDAIRLNSLGGGNVDVTINGTAEGTFTIAAGHIIHVRALGGDDTVTVNAATLPVVLDGGAGNNTLAVASLSAAALTWAVTSPNAGTVGIIAFSNVQDLIGGPGDDAFQFGPKGSLSGGIDGGGGTNTLDLSAHTGANVWDLAGPTASSVNGLPFTNVQELRGGSGNDSVTFIGSHFPNVAPARTFRFQGGGGDDSASLSGSPAADTFTLGPDTATLSGVGYQVMLTGVATIDAHGGANDSALLTDSAGNDTFATLGHAAYMTGAGYKNTVTGFSHIHAAATAGGHDTALLYGAAAGDCFSAQGTAATLTGSGYQASVTGFGNIAAYASAGSSGVAQLMDTAGDDTFTGHGTSAVMTGSGYRDSAYGFTAVKASSVNGGSDQAQFSDTAGNDTFAALGTFASMSGTGYDNSASGFALVQAYSINGGTDTLRTGSVSYTLTVVGPWQQGGIMDAPLSHLLDAVFAAGI